MNTDEATVLESAPAERAESAESAAPVTRRSLRSLRTSSSLEPGRVHAPRRHSDAHRVWTPVAQAKAGLSRVRRGVARRTHGLARSFVVLVVAVFVIGLSVPANAFFSADKQTVVGTAVVSDPGQQVVTAQGVVAETIRTQDWSVLTFAEMLTLKYGSLNFAYATDWTGPIRYPFPVPVTISSGYGARVAPCFYCSTDHNGLDFTPGEGSPIFAIADGVVAEVHEDQWGFGTWVRITHQIDGRVVDSVYAHMQRGSTALKVGDKIKVADFIGTVGSTGTSTGAHLHLEIHVDGVPVDPFIWLGENT